MQNWPLLTACLAPTELWSKYHEHGILQRSEANLWWEEQYAEWDPCKAFDDMELDRGYWAVRSWFEQCV
jgi:hypothetical protein